MLLFFVETYFSFNRRDTVCLSGSVSEWRKLNVKDKSRDSLLSLSSSSSNRRSSLLSQVCRHFLVPVLFITLLHFSGEFYYRGERGRRLH